jgi:hypothetical protein
MLWLARRARRRGEDAVAPPATPIPDPFIDVDRAASAAFVAQGIAGMGLAIYDASGVKPFDKMYRTFAPALKPLIRAAL